jgi:hypothetical protein
MKKVFLVCNMYPQHFHDPVTRNEVLSYIGGRIADASRRAGASGKVRIYAVCALEAWHARQSMDVEAYRRSGAAHLHRDLERFLSEKAGKSLLVESARRIAQAADLAGGEVRVREALLNDPERLAAHRARLDDDVRKLERDLVAAVDAAVAAVEPLRIRVRGMLMRPFSKAKRRVDACKSVEELQEFASKFRREIEVSSEVASRTFQTGFEKVLDQLRSTLEHRFQDVMLEITPSAPKVGLNQRAFLLSSDQLRAMRRDGDIDLTRALSGAAAGSILTGGAAVALAGGILGPVGLLAGARVGRKVGELSGAARGLARTKALLLERLDEIALELTRDFDKQVQSKTASVADLVRRRRRSFASDLYQEFEFVEALAKDFDRAQAYRQECDRFAEAFEDCAVAALRAVGLGAPEGAALGG